MIQYLIVNEKVPLLWIANGTRPDIAFADTHSANNNTSIPGELHWQALLRAPSGLGGTAPLYLLH